MRRSGWQAVHKAMFGAVFNWAAEFRTLHIRKVDETGRQDGVFAWKIPSHQHNIAARQARHGNLLLMKDHFRMILSRSEDPQMSLRHRGD